VPERRLNTSYNLRIPQLDLDNWTETVCQSFAQYSIHTLAMNMINFTNYFFPFQLKASQYRVSEKYADMLDLDENDESSITSFEKGILIDKINISLHIYN
jgi:hypothetical protein